MRCDNVIPVADHFQNALAVGPFLRRFQRQYIPVTLIPFADGRHKNNITVINIIKGLKNK